MVTVVLVIPDLSAQQRLEPSDRGEVIIVCGQGVALDIEKSTLSRNLKRLLHLELIEMDPPAGRRGRGLHLTPKGQVMIKDAYPVWNEAQRRATAILGIESRTALDQLLHNAEKLSAS